MLLFWTYGLAEQQLALHAPGIPETQLDITLSGIWVLLIAFLASWLKRQDRRRAERIAEGLNIMTLILSVMLAIGHFSQERAEPTSTVDAQFATTNGAHTPRFDTPDIYYIVVDGYARTDVLRTHYELENPLPIELRQRGFSVAEQSTSNYYWTFLSLSSSLNLDYLQSLMGSRLDPKSRDRTIPYTLIRDNAAARYLRQHGYRFIQLNSTWGATLENEFADQAISCGGISDDFGRALRGMSWLSVMESDVAINLAHCHSEQFKALGNLAAADGPKFVFAHFLLPHHPYLFDRHGRVLSNAAVSDQFDFQKRLWEDRSAYIEQLLYVNSQLLRTIDQLLQDSPKPPIIVLQSDHGPNLQDGFSLEQQQSIRFANLAAFYLPSAPPSLIPGNITPVNQFRYIFNYYFNAELEILPQQNSYSEYRQPYTLVRADRAEVQAPIAIDSASDGRE